MEECHRRLGRVGPEYQSSRRGRGEQRRPLRRRVGNMGACPPLLRGRSAVCRPNAAYPSGGPKIASHVDFDSTHDGGMEASRLHAAMKSEPVCGDHSAHHRDRRAFQSQALREIPHWWIFSECTLNRQDKRGAPRVRGLTNKQRGAHNCHVAVAVAVDLSSQCHVAVIPVPGAVAVLVRSTWSTWSAVINRTSRVGLSEGFLSHPTWFPFRVSCSFPYNNL